MVGRFAIHVVLPIAIGTWIYVGWRSTDLLVFRWIEFCGLSAFVFRPAVSLPDWVLYCLPDGCWVYAATSWMLLIWQRLVPWAWLALILGVGTELGQLAGFVPGSYDLVDILFYVVAFILAGAIHAQTHLVHSRHLGDDLSGLR